MVEMERGSSSKQTQQISDMIQKFAIAFKTKTYELFAEDDDEGDVTRLLDSAEEFIADQKVVVIKPDSGSRCDDSGAKLEEAFVPSLFEKLSCFEASYLQFQAAHVPEVDQNALESADKSIVAILQKLTELRNIYKDSKRRNGGVRRIYDFTAGSFLEYLVQENQSKLRVLETVANSLQSQIDVKDDEVRNWRKKLDKVRVSNADLLRKLESKEGNANFRIDVLLTLRVFEAMLRDSVKSLRCFTKLLIELMKNAGWDLVEAANHIHSGVNYSRRGYFRYAFLSYISIGMCQDFDQHDFGLSDRVAMSNANASKACENCGNDGEISGYLRQLIEHVAVNPIEILSMNPKSDFSCFCARKYEKLIHPTMESSLFSSFDRMDKVLDSWKSLSVFYESFVRMASSIWLLHKLAYSFNPPVEIFQVARGAEFSIVYMEDILDKTKLPGKAGRRVGFSVVPGFKVGRTLIQSQVYLADAKCS